MCGLIAGLTVLACASFLMRQSAVSGSPESTVSSTSQTVAADQPISSAHRKFTWRDVASSNYLTYLHNLRKVGCPEERLRELVVADVNEFFAAKRLEEAIIHDEEWWRAEPQVVIRDLLREKLEALALERGRTLETLLGTNAPAQEPTIGYGNAVALTGPVLGALSDEVRGRVEEIYRESIDRAELAYAPPVTADGDVRGPNPVEAAARRDKTRKELQTVLSAEQLGEFLIRYSYNAGRLRREFRGIGLTRDEFRKAFRLLDPIDHEMQLEYGTADALSEKQKARYVAQRDEALSKALSPERFQAYLEARNATASGIAATLP